MVCGMVVERLVCVPISNKHDRASSKGNSPTILTLLPHDLLLVASQHYDDDDDSGSNCTQKGLNSTHSFGS